jgi:ACS family hexuronate transporter-like MFS transporter
VSGRAVVVPVVALFAAQFASAFVPFSVGALAPFLRQEYELARSEVGLTGSLIFIAVVVCSLPAGRFTDRAGVPSALLASCGICAAGTALVALAPAVAVAVAGLLVVGVGYSVISPATNRGVIEATPQRIRGRAMGIKQMGVTAAGALAAATLPFAVSRAGLRTALLAAGGAIAAIGIASSATFLRSVGPARVGTGGPARRRPPPALRRRILSLGGAVGGMVAAQHVVSTYLTLFLVDRRAMTATVAAGYLTILHASGTVARLAWGWLSDRLGSRFMTITVIGTVSIVSLLTLGTLGATLPTLLLVPLVVVLGAATQGGNAVYQIAIAEADAERAGWASGVGMTLGFSGGIVAPPAFGAVVDATGSYTVGLVVTAGIVAIAIGVVRQLSRSGSAGAAPAGTAPPMAPVDL